MGGKTVKRNKSPENRILYPEQQKRQKHNWARKTPSRAFGDPNVGHTDDVFKAKNAPNEAIY